MAFLFLSSATHSETFYHLCIVLTDKTNPQESLTQETRVEECWKQDFPLVKKDWVREHLCKTDIHKSMGPEHSSNEQGLLCNKESKIVSKTELTCRDGFKKKNSETT